MWVIEEMSTLGNSTLLLIDACGEEELLIRDGSGHLYQFLYKVSPNPSCSEGKYAGNNGGGEPVYCKSPESMVIPYKGTNDLVCGRLLRCQVRREWAIQSLSINELPSIEGSLDSVIIELGVPRSGVIPNWTLPNSYTGTPGCEVPV
jgi:hypothetical protein